MSIFSSVAGDIVKGAKAFKAEVLKIASATPSILAKIEADAPEVEALTNLIFPGAAAIEAAGLTVLEEIASAVESAGGATAADGLSVALDQNTLAQIKAILPTLKQFVKTGK